MPTDEKSLRKDIENLVRKTVEETPDALLDEEAPGLVGTERYEGTAGREADRSGHYVKKLVIGAGEVETSAPGCSVGSRRCSPGLATGAARCISTATCQEGHRDHAKDRGAHVEGDQRSGIARDMRREGRRGGDELESM